ncbi:hypothetical protein Q9V03_000756 [Salmonella enterica]|nr:hypothetical protein [Salmonella enterica]
MAKKTAVISRDMNDWARRETDSYRTRVIKGAAKAAKDLQDKINKRLDRPTRFTNEAVNHNYKRYGDGRFKTTVWIDKKQSAYLEPIFEGKTISKYTPYHDDVVTQHGNIKGLQNFDKKRIPVTRRMMMNAQAGPPSPMRYVSVDIKGKRFIIDRAATKYKQNAHGTIYNASGNKGKKRKQDGTLKARKNKPMKRLVAVKERETRKQVLESWERNADEIFNTVLKVSR